VGGSINSIDIFADAIKNTLATELDIHSSDIEIMYDSDSGVATYTITSDEAESLTPIINELQQDDFDLSSENISIELIDPPTDIILNIDVSVDSSGVIDVDTRPDQTQSVFEAVGELDKVSDKERKQQLELLN
jgi:hypothetical protein